jgi:hypothetical protein
VGGISRGSYGLGQVAALVFGLALVIVGAQAIWKHVRARDAESGSGRPG